MVSREGLGNLIWHSFSKLGINVQPKEHSIPPPPGFEFDFPVQDESTAKVEERIQSLYQRFRSGEIAPCQADQERKLARDKYAGEITYGEKKLLLVPIELFKSMIGLTFKSKLIPNGETGGKLYYENTDGLQAIVGYELNPNILDALAHVHSAYDIETTSAWVQGLREARQGRGLEIDRIALNLITILLSETKLREAKPELERLLFHEDIQLLAKTNNVVRLLEIFCETGYMPSNSGTTLLGKRTQLSISHHTHPENYVIGPSAGDMEAQRLSAISRLGDLTQYLVFYHPHTDHTRIFHFEGIEMRNGELYAVLNLGRYRSIPKTHEASQSVPLKGEALGIFNWASESIVGIAH